MIIRRTLATLALAALALGAAAGTASAAESNRPVTKADKQALKQANALCRHVSDDWTWEACVTGQLQVQRPGRAVLSDDYVSGSAMTLTAGTRPVGNVKHKASKADKRALKVSLSRCAYLQESDDDDLTVAWAPCVLGMFTFERNRALREADYDIRETYAAGTDQDEVTGVTFVLLHGSHKVGK